MSSCSPIRSGSKVTASFEEFREELEGFAENVQANLHKLMGRLKEDIRRGIREELEQIFQDHFAAWEESNGGNSPTNSRRLLRHRNGSDVSLMRSVKFRSQAEQDKERPHFWRGRTLKTYQYRSAKTNESMMSMSSEVSAATQMSRLSRTYGDEEVLDQGLQPEGSSPSNSRRVSLTLGEIPSRRASTVSNATFLTEPLSGVGTSVAPPPSPGTFALAKSLTSVSEFSDLPGLEQPQLQPHRSGSKQKRRMSLPNRLRPEQRTNLRPSSLFTDGCDLDELAHLVRGEGSSPVGSQSSPLHAPRRAVSMRLIQPVIVTPLRGTVHEFATNFVRSQYFEHGVGVLVLLNAVALGLETDFQAQHRQSELPVLLSMSETLFCVFFLLELLLKIFVYRGQFCRMDGWQWNMFDAVVVSMQVIEQVAIALRSTRIFSGASHLRIVRVLRLVRITRLIRVLRLQEELRTIMTSIMSSMESLGWTLLLLAMMVYIFSVVITQVVAECNGDSENYDALHYWFGSLSRSILTMFESIVGGATWDAVVAPLIYDISPLLGFVFCFYIVICVFAIMNVVTAAFVEKATRTAQEDKDMYLANHISDLFFHHPELGASPDITWEEFNEKLDTREMQEYFRQINLDPSEARGIFELLDTDGSGSVDPEEIVHGCLRLRGTAKALELSLLTHECNRMQRRMEDHQEKVEAQLSMICQLLKDEL